jgi:hypothetical protein
LTGWTDKIWRAQASRLEYLLANGVKEGLVERVRDWPGVHCVRNLLDGEPLGGLWFDRTKEYSARNRGKTISPGQFATTETVTLSPLPCPSRALRGVSSVPGSFSRRREPLASGRPHRAIPAGKLSVGPAFRRCLGSSRSPWIATFAHASGSLSVASLLPSVVAELRSPPPEPLFGGISFG